MEGEDGGITLFASPRAPKRSSTDADALKRACRVAESSTVAKRARAAEVGDAGSLELPGAPRSGASSAANARTGAQETPGEKDEAAGTFCSGLAAARPSNVSGVENSWEEGVADASDSSPATFSSLGLPPWLTRACESLGMTSPTPVQRAVIPALLSGRDAVAIAHTGSGKTASFALPILSALAPDPYGVFALVLSPTRELAFQLAEQFRALGVGCGLRDAVVVGGLDQLAQARELSRRPHVVVASPGRLRALFVADPGLRGAFAKLRFLVMDEADRLLEDSFESDLAAVLQSVSASPRSPKGAEPSRQTVLVSATLTPAMWAVRRELPPTALLWRAYRGLETVRGSRLREEYALVPARVKNVYAAHVLAQLQDLGVRSAMVFTATCAGCENLTALLRELDLPCAQLSSGLAQRQRLAALDRFRSGRVPVLVATDVAARGLDIPAVDLVLNFDLPRLARDYVHRVGRTARAGRGGWALSLVSQHDVDLVHRIESLVGHQLVATEACPEKEVLKGLHRVFEAQRVAALAVQDRQRKVEQRAGGGRAVLRERSEKRRARLDAR